MDRSGKNENKENQNLRLLPLKALFHYIEDMSNLKCRSLYLCFQGLCLIDWGRGIDVNLFPDGTVFHGDCRTSGFRCVQMQEKHKWKFQVHHLILNHFLLAMLPKKAAAFNSET